MATIVTRSGKGSPLTHAEVDSNFTNLNTDKLETAGGTMTGNLTVPNVIVSGNVDGRDVSADGAKLDGIEANADVTDTANVTAAGALMDSELTDIAAVKALNQGVATTDAPTFTNTQLNAIAATISDTAVDIFVYDTRKDSDGGAWRKRTQHTSWYNETLNTATRGSRKEFPAVAVIVAEAGTVTIYDGDDPDLPMWMVFDTSNSGGAWSGEITTSNFDMLVTGATTSVSMLNGTLVGGGGTAVVTVNFVDERSVYRGSQSNTDGVYAGTIAERNANKGHRGESNLGLLVQSTVNDVAMTVLPNAPIDAATGLPVPTIAVATDGGVSVIKDDGTIVDDTSVLYVNNSAHEIDFTSDNRILRTSRDRNYVSISDIPSSDTSTVASNTIAISALDRIIPTTTAIEYRFAGNHGTNAVKGMHDTLFAAGASSGLNISDASSIISDGVGSTAYITSDYNTGWMNGDIKLATLSDTDDTNVTGSELSPTLDFDVGTNWTLIGIYVTASDADTFVNSQPNQGVSASVFTDGLDNTYTVSVDIDGPQVEFRNGTSGSSSLMASSYTTGQRTVTFTVKPSSAGNSSYMYIRGTAAGTYNVNSISVRLAEEDRSVNGNGLQVFGTVTKSAVSSGADLVAYSGFSSSNYLQQPVNTDLQFGTNDWAFYGWYYGASSNNTSTIFELANSVVAGTHIGVRYDPANNLEMFVTDDGFASSEIIEYPQTPSNVWQFFCAIRRGNVVELWNNGKLKVSTTLVNAAGALVDSTAFLRIGNRTYVDQPFGGALALFRASATAPSPEQIRKIYEDEKVLFQEGAQATLYGSSDAVTALAYDDSTNLLHVGTSAGRSVFQGLRRVDNTTTAVGAAISASGGLVADE